MSKTLRRPTYAESYAQRKIRESLDYQLNPNLGERMAQAALRCTSGADRENVSLIIEKAREYALINQKGLVNG